MATQYLTFDEYVELGGTLPKTAFTLAEFKARKRIDYLTDSRVQNMAAVPEAVKLCMMSLITVESTVGLEAQVESPTVTSFNTDGYSENYGNIPKAADAEKGMNDLVKTSLYGEVDDKSVPLLYRGVRGY